MAENTKGSDTSTSTTTPKTTTAINPNIGKNYKPAVAESERGPITTTGSNYKPSEYYQTKDFYQRNPPIKPGVYGPAQNPFIVQQGSGSTGQVVSLVNNPQTNFLYNDPGYRAREQARVQNARLNDEQQKAATGQANFVTKEGQTGTIGYGGYSPVINASFGSPNTSLPGFVPFIKERASTFDKTFFGPGKGIDEKGQADFFANTVIQGFGIGVNDLGGSIRGFKVPGGDFVGRVFEGTGKYAFYDPQGFGVGVEEDIAIGAVTGGLLGAGIKGIAAAEGVKTAATAARVSSYTLGGVAGASVVTTGLLGGPEELGRTLPGFIAGGASFGYAYKTIAPSRVELGGLVVKRDALEVRGSKEGFTAQGEGIVTAKVTEFGISREEKIPVLVGVSSEGKISPKISLVSARTMGSINIQGKNIDFTERYIGAVQTNKNTGILALSSANGNKLFFSEVRAFGNIDEVKILKSQTATFVKVGNNYYAKTYGQGGLTLQEVEYNVVRVKRPFISPDFSVYPTGADLVETRTYGGFLSSVSQKGSQGVPLPFANRGFLLAEKSGRFNLPSIAGRGGSSPEEFFISDSGEVVKVQKLPFDIGRRGEVGRGFTTIEQPRYINKGGFGYDGKIPRFEISGLPVGNVDISTPSIFFGVGYGIGSKSAARSQQDLSYRQESVSLNRGSSLNIVPSIDITPISDIGFGFGFASRSGQAQTQKQEFLPISLPQARTDNTFGSFNMSVPSRLGPVGGLMGWPSTGGFRGKRKKRQAARDLFVYPLSSPAESAFSLTYYGSATSPGREKLKEFKFSRSQGGFTFPTYEQRRARGNPNYATMLKRSLL